MKQKIVIRNLGPIKHADIDIKPLTVLIGESGSGKSIIMRTMSMCKWVIKKTRFKSLNTLNSNRIRLDTILKNSMLDDFFTKDTSIEFFIDDNIVLSIQNNKLNINFKKNLLQNYPYNKILFLNENRVALPEILSTPGGRRIKLSTYTNDMIENFYEASNFYNNEASNFYNNGFSLNTMPIKLSKKDLPFGNTQYYIENNDKKIKFEHASSGEKNSAILEMILKYFVDDRLWFDNALEYVDKSIEKILLTLQLDKDIRTKILKAKQNNITTKLSAFIEEPEANLFPTNQMKMLYFLISMVNNNNEPEIVFATHSPYMLTALNNSLHASYVLKITKNNENKVYEIIKKEHIIDEENVAAYIIENGEAKNILEDGLIDADKIDKASSDIMDDFSRLCDLDDEF